MSGIQRDTRDAGKYIHSALFTLIKHQARQSKAAWEEGLEGRERTKKVHGSEYIISERNVPADFDLGLLGGFEHGREAIQTLL